MPIVTDDRSLQGVGVGLPWPESLKAVIEALKPLRLENYLRRWYDYETDRVQLDRWLVGGKARIRARLRVVMAKMCGWGGDEFPPPGVKTDMPSDWPTEQDKYVMKVLGAVGEYKHGHQFANDEEADPEASIAQLAAHYRRRAVRLLQCRGVKIGGDAWRLLALADDPRYSSWRQTQAQVGAQRDFADRVLKYLGVRTGGA